MNTGDRRSDLAAHPDDGAPASRASVRTKIVATLGPATDDPATLRALIEAGMNAARLNFSHGTRAAQAERLAAVRAAAAELDRPVAVIQDLQGPRLRIGEVAAGTRLAAGAGLVLDDRAEPGDADGVGLARIERLAPQIAPGQRILIDDGAIELRVLAVAGRRIETEVRHGGPLHSKKGVNLPDTVLDLPALTDKDRADLAFGLELGLDYVALSFVGSAEDLRGLQALIRRAGHAVPVIGKIERLAAVEAMDAIVDQAEGLMVARGDLALEIGAARVPAVQKRLIRAANAASIPVITATQMLDSMIRNPRPTRAETSDVANAILDGTDAVMLSGETAVGAYPVAAVAEMASIAREAERILDYRALGDRARSDARRPASFAISRAAVEIARSLEPRAIIAVTSSGQTAGRVAHHRPETPLIGATRGEETWRRLALVWGVTPLRVPDYRSTDEMVRVVADAACAAGLAAEGDRLVITSGLPIGKPGSTNMVQVRRVGDWREAALQPGESEPSGEDPSRSQG